MLNDPTKAEQLIRTARDQQEARYRELLAQRNAIDREIHALAESIQVWGSVLGDAPQAEAPDATDGRSKATNKKKAKGTHDDPLPPPKYIPPVIQQL